VKNLSSEDEEEQVSVTLLPEIDNDGENVQIPDTAHQISTGLLFLQFHDSILGNFRLIIFKCFFFFGL
jgi:hypothetical protein